MIKPTIGRVVWYYAHGAHQKQLQPEAALVAYVHGDRMVNLAVFNDVGVARGETSVTLIQDDDEVGDYGLAAHCCWMPYQKGQAAKTEAVEAALVSAKAQS